MGNGPVSVSGEQREELRSCADERCRAAAKAISEADVFLLFTGAGFSADSGLAVYADVAKVPAYHDRGLEYHDICQPQWLFDEPELFWGFWGQCYNDYRETAPHEGYTIISRWAEQRFRNSSVSELIQEEYQEQALVWEQQADLRGPYEVSKRPGAFFAFTSNVDAHHFDHFKAHEIRECHGNTELYQCAHRCDDTVWRAPRSLRYVVDRETMLAPAGHTAVDAGAAAVVAAEVDHQDQAVPACGRVRGGGRPGALRYMTGGDSDPRLLEAFASNHPRCMLCGGPARPAILMFGDHGWTDVEEQSSRWTAWTNAVESVAKTRGPDFKVAMLEIGAGGNVTTVRHTAEQVLEDLLACGADARLFRVNPDMPLADRDHFDKGRVVSILGRGLDCIRKIDAAMPPAMT